MMQQVHILAGDTIEAEVKARTTCRHIIYYFNIVLDFRQSEGEHVE
jgi:hypothetical protein